MSSHKVGIFPKHLPLPRSINEGGSDEPFGIQDKTFSKPVRTNISNSISQHFSAIGQRESRRGDIRTEEGWGTQRVKKGIITVRLF